MARRFIPLLLFIFFIGCVLKGTHNETLAQNIELSTELTTVKKERDALKTQLDDAQKRLSQLEARNEELSTTNQMLVGKNAEYARKSTETQQEVMRLKQEKTKQDEQTEFPAKAYEDLLRMLKQESSKGLVRVGRDGDRLTVVLSDQILFSPGGDKIAPKGQKILKEVIPILKNLKNRPIEVQGHTDDQPISPSSKGRFPTNWEFSAAKASKVVRFLEENGFGSENLAAVGYGENRPIASNDSAEGRKKNRRVEIVVFPLSRSLAKNP